MATKKKPAAKKRAKTPARKLEKAPTAKRVAVRLGRESRQAKRARAAEIVRRLRGRHPDARCSLDHRNAYELLTATILSAQCTDERVNRVTPALFERYPAPVDLAGARQNELEDMIKSTGFFRNKARSLLGMAGALVDRHQGKVPDTMQDLVGLPGVGRKTANVVLGNAFGMNEGVVVDTHVTRVAGRLALTRHRDPVKIEQDLMPVVPREDWTDLSHLFIYHGRATCKAPTPLCGRCVLVDLCPSARV